MIEKDIQNYLYDNLDKLPKLIGINQLKQCFTTKKEDLIFNPLKYLLYKKYNYIFENMDHFTEHSLHRFSKEFNTAEDGNSIPRIDILAYHSDPSTFYIMEVKGNKGPERQTITELLQYSNGLQTNDFPGLSNNNIVFVVVVAEEWSNILVQSVVNGIIFKNLNILTIKVQEGKKEDFDFKFFDLWDKEIIHNLNKQIFNEKNYYNRMLAFDDLKEGLDVDYNDMKTIIMMTGNYFSKEGKIGYVLGTDSKDTGVMYKHCISILEFNPFLLELKKWEGFTRKKSKEIYDFSQEYLYDIDTRILRDKIKFYYPDKDLSFEEGFEGIGLTQLWKQGRFFNSGYPFGFLELLIIDLIQFCRKDKDFAELIIQTDDFNGKNEIFHWDYLSKLFEVYNSKVKNLEELNDYMLNN